MTLHRPPPHIAARGFSLPELMIALTLGLVILAGLTTLFVNNSQAQAEVEKANRQIENGRFAMQTLAGDLRNAGFYGELDPTTLPTPGTLPDPCQPQISALKNALPLHVQGVDNGAATLSCISDVAPNTDVLVVRHASTCITGGPNCDAASAGGPFLQASLCNNGSELSSSDSGNFYSLDATTSGMTRHKRDCTLVPGSGTPAAIRRYLTHIYFIANNSEAGDAIPTLKRVELGMTNGGLTFKPAVALVEGVQNMQLEYGMDRNNDGVPEVFSSNPATAEDWRNVMSVRVSLLARSVEPSSGYADSKTYVLGNDASGNPIQVAGSGAYRRHVFQSMVGLVNPAGRRLQ